MSSKKRPVFGKDTASTWSRDFQNEGKREYDRRSKQRQRLRSKFAPEPMFFDDDPGPDRLRSGLIAPFVPRRQKGDDGEA